LLEENGSPGECPKRYAKIMKNGLVLVVSDKLEPFTDILMQFRKTSSYETRTIDLNGLLVPENLKELPEYGVTRCCLIIEHSIFGSNAEKIAGFMRTVLGEPFGNYLIIHGPGDTIDPASAGTPEENHYPLAGDADPTLQALNLELHVNILMKNSTLMDRLTRYISDSFKVVVYSELINRKNKEIEVLNKELEMKNKIDSLTNLFNRSTLFELLELERKRTIRDLWRLENTNPATKASPSRGAQPKLFDGAPKGYLTEHFGSFALMMIDLDNFKNVNDRYGHLAGDTVLRAFGTLFHDTRILRENDIAGRFGGEEFIAILPETNALHAMEPATRFMERFQKIDFDSGNGDHFNVTCSIGISEFHPTDKTCEDIVARADKALYYAKEHGRNQIVIYEDVFPFA
jgi:diguanylate cyclase (GGDEF)-like protein